MSFKNYGRQTYMFFFKITKNKKYLANFLAAVICIIHSPYVKNRSGDDVIFRRFVRFRFHVVLNHKLLST